jgi:hypothetical protein
MALQYAPMRCANHPVWKLTFAQKEELTERYVAGERLSTLSAEFGIGSASVQLIARRRGASKRGVKRLPLNHAAFSEITPDSAYWAGFLMADGSVSARVVCLFLGEKDRHHLEEFKRFLAAEHKITTTTRKGVTCSAFSAASTQIIADLATYGVVPRKSLTARCARLETDRDFWRGVVDGDGWLGYKVTRGRWRYAAITLCGSVCLMTQFAYFISQHNEGRFPKVTRRGSIFAVHVSGQLAIKIARLLYEGAATALPRKQALAVGMYSLLPHLPPDQTASMTIEAVLPPTVAVATGAVVVMPDCTISSEGTVS